MPWNSTWPVGNVSVRTNRTTGQQNTTYIEDTMGISPVGTNNTSVRDHFWDVGADEDGRHRFIQSPGFTVGGVPTDPVIGTGMDCVEYPKTTNGRVERFHRNAQGIYQHVPSFLTGTHTVTGSYTNIIAVPANVYGEIFMFRTTAGNHTAQAGFFRSNGSVVEAWSYAMFPEGETIRGILKFANGADASGLNLRVRTENATSGNSWEYRITYRAN